MRHADIETSVNRFDRKIDTLTDTLREYRGLLRAAEPQVDPVLRQAILAALVSKAHLAISYSTPTQPQDYD
jgi:hypothetical protein